VISAHVKKVTSGGMEFGAAVSRLGWRVKNVGDLIMDGKESLHLPWRLEAFHDLLSSSRRLVQIRCPIVEGFMLACSTPGMISRLAGSVAA
jgi:hypothetical protein